MLKSIEFKKFRCFQDLKLKPLERVNLVAGVNNIGKTVLLEGLWIHHGVGNPSTAWRVNVFRGLDQFRTQDDPVLRSLFYDFHSDVPAKIFARDLDENEFSLTIRLLKDQPTRIPVGKQTKDTTNVIGEQIEYEYAKNSKKISAAYGFFEKDDFQIGQTEERGGFKNLHKIAIFLPGRMRPPFKEDAERYSNLDALKETGHVTETLQKIEPRLRRISLGLINDLPIIQADIGIERLIPIPLLGDGMARLLSLSLAIGNARDGVVLVDEIENGLHHAILVQVWRAVADLARKFNVQVFSTTHSEECIRVAHEAFEKEETYDFRLHRLDRVDSTIRSVTYDQETLTAALETGLEVR